MNLYDHYDHEDYTGGAITIPTPIDMPDGIRELLRVRGRRDRRALEKHPNGFIRAAIPGEFFPYVIANCDEVFVCQHQGALAHVPLPPEWGERRYTIVRAWYESNGEAVPHVHLSDDEIRAVLATAPAGEHTPDEVSLDEYKEVQRAWDMQQAVFDLVHAWEGVDVM